ncbi:hypothetical protein HHI36_007158 [Cryptolaemus montrouzieri]|uniref:Uncharacterized protein n=1 Tax=Cryptolaemus montrouzieri TaxID=559131 RepID=A0ABD2MP38_9CUCU
MVNPPSVEHTFRQCLISTSVATGGVGHCLGMGLINKLQSWDSEPEFDLVDGVTLTKDPKEYRESFSFSDSDPSSFRSIVDSFGQVFSRRQMRWDMGYVYPGLTMHITPSPGTAGVLEFALDPHKEALNRHSLKDVPTGRLLARQFLVPILLGFKFNVVTIIPIIFGILALIAKKAVLLSKLALIISSAFGLGTLLLGNSRFPQNHYGGGIQGGGFPGGGSHFGGGFGHHHINRYPEHEYDTSYKTNTIGRGEANQRANKLEDLQHRNTNEKTEDISEDQFKLTANLQDVVSTGSGKSDGRNFAWSEEEKIVKRG